MVKSMSTSSSSSSTTSSLSALPDPDDSSSIIAEKKKSTSTVMLRRSSRRTKSTSNPISSFPSKNTKSTNSISSSPSNNNNNNDDDDDDMIFLEKWIHHDDHTYHLEFLSPTQSYKIRMALVEWYRANRRKLPWRGDGGPYDGSTAGFASKTTTTKKGNIRKEKGKDIRSFFGTDASSNKRKRKLGEGKEVSVSKVSKAKGKNDGDSKVEDDAQALMFNPPREITAYGVWVSEIMLQQTRVEAVIPYYLKWMSSFPTVHDLAAATEEEVNAHWAGLGFYRRARFLHAGAKRVVNEYNGIVPNTVDELMKVEGIGRYTASAVGSIAYGVEVPVVDGNVCRVLSRLTGIANHIKAGVMKDDLGWVLADRIIKAKISSSGEEEIENIEGCYETIGSPGEVNQALMELGATYCSPSGSGVDDGDPLKDFYVSTRLGVAIGRAMNDSSKRGHVENLIAKKAFATNNQGKCCRLCDPNGISTAYYNIMDQMNDDSYTDSKTNAKKAYAIAGHASLPIPPPKKSKREEVIAVAVISSQPSSGKEERCWLMVKRPPKGLLAGQWEFPSVCVWNSAKDDDNGGPKKKKKKGEKSPKKSAVVEVPLVDPVVRSNALDSFLSDIFPSDGDGDDDNDDLPSAINLSKRSQVKDAPVVHIFSHVCHTMWIEYGEFEADGDHQLLRTKKWKLGNGQEIGWMTERDMASVGITSGVRKVMAKASTSRRKKSR